MTGNPAWGRTDEEFVKPPGQPLSIDSLEPNTAEMGSADLTMIVNGKGFNDKSVILWNGSEEPTHFISQKQVSTGVKPSTATGPYTCTVAVRNPSGEVTAQLPFAFTEVAGPLVIWEIVPPEGPVNDEDFQLDVYGQNFGVDSTIVFDGTVRATVFVTVGHLTARIKERDHAEGQVQVLVRNPMMDSNAVTYTYTAPVAEVELEEVEEIEEEKPVKRKRRKRRAT
jgi:hypothetical protein